MPAKSKKQQRFMGMVLATQRGALKDPSPEVARAASSISSEDAKDFAKTKRKSLPEKAASVRERIAAWLLAESTAAEKTAFVNYAPALAGVAERFLKGEPLIPSLKAEFPKLSSEQANRAARLIIDKGLAVTTDPKRDEE